MVQWAGTPPNTPHANLRTEREEATIIVRVRSGSWYVALNLIHAHRLPRLPKRVGVCACVCSRRGPFSGGISFFTHTLALLRCIVCAECYSPPPLSFLLPQFFLIYYAAGRGAPGKHARDPVGESVFYVRHRDRHVQ